MIVKNEASCLLTALNSVKDADEIIVCDTGSTDNTVQIATDFGCKVYTDFVWCDDFAKARNHAASKCTQDYVLILDADETLEDNTIEILRGFNGVALSFQTECANTGQVHQSIRLHKNTPTIQWVGAIHNYLNVDPDFDTPVKITYGWSKSHNYDPDRTLRILKKETKKNPYSTREQYYLGIEYVNKKQYDKALYWLKRYVNKSTHTAEKADAYVMIARILWSHNKRDEARTACMNAIILNPDFKEALGLMSRITTDAHRLKWQRFADIAEDTGVLFKRDPKRIVVTVLCEEDFAGSGYRMLEAIRNADPLNVDIEQIVMRYSSFGYRSGRSVADLGWNTVQDRLNRSDIIHFKGDFCYPDGVWNGFELPKSAKYIYTVGGSFFRRGADPLVSYGDIALTDYKADYLSVLTPDLIYSDDWEWTPHAWNEFDYRFKKGKTFKVLHIPSDPEKKNTPMIDKAMQIVLAKRADVSYFCVNNISHAESVEMKAHAHLYIDQMRTDAYGNAALEAMAFGVPTVCWLGDYYPDRTVISPVENTAESLAETILSYLDWSVLEEHSKKTFAYVKKYHGLVGHFWIKKYKQLI